MRDQNLNRLITKLFSLLLIALGFSACDSDGPREMYGTPTAEFTIKGKVVHAEDKERPLQDIQIVIHPLLEKHGEQYADTLFTGKDGTFEWNSYMTFELEYRVIYEEQEKNAGEIPLKKGQVDVEMKQVEKGKGAWNRGKYEADVFIEMENDNPAEPE